ncbi:hypothetical protein PanWU01x14_358020 [Parasponia andersonii]|nr:hypothetical protein PanWU01x14_358020 [Parasponia andersonii]
MLRNFSNGVWDSTPTLLAIINEIHVKLQMV